MRREAGDGSSRGAKARVLARCARGAWFTTTALLIACSSSEFGELGEACGPMGACSIGLECFRGVCAESAMDVGVPPDAAALPDAGITDAATAPDAQDPGAPDTDVDAGLVPPRPALGWDDTGPTLPRPPEGAHAGIPDLFDAALDWERHRLFVTHGRGGAVDVIDLTTGAAGTLETGSPRAEHLFFDPRRDEVVVTLPDADHTWYVFGVPEHGHLSAIDPAALSMRVPVAIPIDPWEIVADGFGNVLVTGASNQWSTIVAVNLETGVSHVGPMVLAQESLALHPSRVTAYGSSPDTGSFSRFDYDRTSGDFAVVDGAISGCGEVRVAPDGATLLVQCGARYLIPTLAADGSLSGAWTDAAFHPAGHRIFVARPGTRAMDVYDGETLALLGSIGTAGELLRILPARDYVVLAVLITGGLPRLEYEVRWYESL